MDLKITTLGGKDAGKVKLSEEIFGLDPREDILQRVVRWQLASWLRRTTADRNSSGRRWRRSRHRAAGWRTARAPRPTARPGFCRAYLARASRDLRHRRR